MVKKLLLPLSTVQYICMHGISTYCMYLQPPPSHTHTECSRGQHRPTVPAGEGAGVSQ